MSPATFGWKLLGKMSKMPSPTTLSQIFRERFNHGSPNCTALLTADCLTDVSDITSLAAASQLQNV